MSSPFVYLLIPAFTRPNPALASATPRSLDAIPPESLALPARGVPPSCGPLSISSLRPVPSGRATSLNSLP